MRYYNMREDCAKEAMRGKRTVSGGRVSDFQNNFTSVWTYPNKHVNFRLPRLKKISGITFFKDAQATQSIELASVNRSYP